MKFFQVKEVKDAKVEEEKKEEEEEKTVKREGMMVDSGKDVVDLVSFFFRHISSHNSCHCPHNSHYLQRSLFFVLFLLIILFICEGE